MMKIFLSLLLLPILGYSQSNPDSLLRVATQSHNLPQIEELLAKGANPMAIGPDGTTTFQLLQNWISGFGDGAFIQQAAIAELFFKAGASIDPTLIEAPLRVLEEARTHQYTATLRQLEHPLLQSIHLIASDSLAYPLSDCEVIEQREVRDGKIYLFSGCSKTYDGTQAYYGNQTILYADSGSTYGQGKIGPWGRTGRWLFYDEQGVRIKQINYFKGQQVNK